MGRVKSKYMADTMDDMGDGFLPFAVKAQCSLFSSTGKAMILVYDNGKHVLHEGEVDKAIAEQIGDRSFWWATIDNGKISLQSDNPATEADFEKYDYKTMNGERNAN